MVYRILLCCMLCLASFLPARADTTVKVGDKPFTGKIEGSGADTFVELFPLVTALDLKRDAVLGGWYVYHGERSPADENRNVTSADQVWANGVRVGDHKTGGAYMVNLRDFSEAFHLELQSPEDNAFILMPATNP